MNDLNSVLMEGRVIDPPEQLDSMAAHFTIETVRDGLPMPVRLVAYGKLAESCARNLTVGRGIRAVGRLTGHPDKSYILVEHVEFKPVYESEEESE